jgi:hypothetical protein
MFLERIKATVTGMKVRKYLALVIKKIRKDLFKRLIYIYMLNYN